MSSEEEVNDHAETVENEATEPATSSTPAPEQGDPKGDSSSVLENLVSTVTSLNERISGLEQRAGSGDTPPRRGWIERLL